MATASLLLNPLDVIKVRMQFTPSASRSMFTCAKISALQAGGFIRGLVLPGLAATFVRDVLNGSFRVGLYKEIERQMFTPDSSAPILVRKLVTGLVIGATGAGLWSHTDLIKTRMQLDHLQKRLYRSTWDAYRVTYRTEGMTGLYRGVGPNMIRAGLITTCHVGSYDFLKNMLSMHVGDNSVTWTVCGFMSALVTTTIAAPIDLIRTRVMAQSVAQQSTWSVARSVFTNEGMTGFFRGWMASFMRFGPHFTISWPLIELSRRYVFELDSF
jgi:dicarboxylate transporter 10